METREVFDSEKKMVEVTGEKKLYEKHIHMNNLYYFSSENHRLSSLDYIWAMELVLNIFEA